MIVEVLKINIDKEIPDATFEVPKDFVIKPIKDMQSADGRGIQIRMNARGRT